MGGFGSGRPPGGGRATVEACLALDVGRLRREGCLTPGWSGSCRWTRGDRLVASVALLMEPDRLVLAYRRRGGAGGWEVVEEEVAVDRVPCHLGGGRPYFVCPGVA